MSALRALKINGGIVDKSLLKVTVSSLEPQKEVLSVLREKKKEEHKNFYDWDVMISGRGDAGSSLEGWMNGL